MKNVRKTVKKFLSSTPYEYGSVCWEVVVDPRDSYELIQADLRISDCSKHVDLSMGTTEAKHLKNRIQKIDVLIRELQAMKEFMMSYEVQEAVKYKIEAKKEKKCNLNR